MSDMATATNPVSVRPARTAATPGKSLPVEPKSVIWNPSPEQLRQFADQMPNARQAADWIADAQRFAAARAALDMLETTAILDPRELRDSSGQRVQQPSPIAQASPAR